MIQDVLQIFGFGAAPEPIGSLGLAPLQPFQLVLKNQLEGGDLVQRPGAQRSEELLAPSLQISHETLEAPRVELVGQPPVKAEDSIDPLFTGRNHPEAHLPEIIADSRTTEPEETSKDLLPPLDAANTPSAPEDGPKDVEEDSQELDSSILFEPVINAGSRALFDELQPERPVFISIPPPSVRPVTNREEKELDLKPSTPDQLKTFHQTDSKTIPEPEQVGLPRQSRLESIQPDPSSQVQTARDNRFQGEVTQENPSKASAVSQAPADQKISPVGTAAPGTPSIELQREGSSPSGTNGLDERPVQQDPVRPQTRPDPEVPGAKTDAARFPLPSRPENRPDAILETFGPKLSPRPLDRGIEALLNRGQPVTTNRGNDIGKPVLPPVLESPPSEEPPVQTTNKIERIQPDSVEPAERQVKGKATALEQRPEVGKEQIEPRPSTISTTIPTTTPTTTKESEIGPRAVPAPRTERPEKADSPRPSEPNQQPKQSEIAQQTGSTERSKPIQSSQQVHPSQPLARPESAPRAESIQGYEPALEREPVQQPERARGTGDVKQTESAPRTVPPQRAETTQRFETSSQQNPAPRSEPAQQPELASRFDRNAKPVPGPRFEPIQRSGTAQTSDGFRPVEPAPSLNSSQESRSPQISRPSHRSESTPSLEPIQRSDSTRVESTFRTDQPDVRPEQHQEPTPSPKVGFAEIKESSPTVSRAQISSTESTISPATPGKPDLTSEVQRAGKDTLLDTPDRKDDSSYSSPSRDLPPGIRPTSSGADSAPGFPLQNRETASPPPVSEATREILDPLPGRPDFAGRSTRIDSTSIPTNQTNQDEAPETSIQAGQYENPGRDSELPDNRQFRDGNSSNEASKPYETQTTQTQSVSMENLPPNRSVPITAPTATSAPATPNAPLETSREAFAQLVLHVDPTKEEAVIHLQPEELGSVLVHLRHENDGIHATFETDNKVATDLIDQKISDLREGLENNGMKLLSLHVSTQAPRKEHPGQGRNRPSPRAETRNRRVPSYGASPAQSAGGKGLDIRI